MNTVTGTPIRQARFRVAYIEVGIGLRAAFEDVIKYFRARGLDISYTLEQEMFLDTYLDFEAAGDPALVLEFQAWHEANRQVDSYEED